MKMILIFKLIFCEPTTKDRFMKYKEVINSASVEYDVDYNVLASMLYIESRFDKDALSPTGCKGISQFSIATANQYDVNREDPIDSIFGMARVIRHHKNNFPKYFTDEEKTLMSVYQYSMGKGSYFKAKKIVLDKGLSASYKNILNEISKNKKNKQGIEYVELLKVLLKKG